MAVFPWTLKLDADAQQAIEQINLLTNSYYRLSSATSQGVIRFQAGGHGPYGKLFEIMETLPVFLTRGGRFLEGVTEKIRESVHEAGSIERELFNIGVQGNLSGEQISEFAERLNELEVSTNQTGESLAEVAKQMLGVGASSEQALAMMEPVGRFMRLFPTLDAHTAAELGAVAWAKFGRQLSDPARLMDRVLTLTRSFKGDPHGVLTFFQSLRGVAEIAPDQIDNIFAIGAALGRTSGSAAEAGAKTQGFVQGLLTLEKAALQAEMAHNKFGGKLKLIARDLLNLRSFSGGQFQDLLTILRNIEEAEAGMTEQQRAVTMTAALRKSTIEAIDAISNLVVTTDQHTDAQGRSVSTTLTGIDALQELQRQLRNSDGEISRMSEQVGNLSSDVESRLVNSTHRFSEAIGMMTKGGVDALDEMKIKIIDLGTSIVETSGHFGEAVGFMAFNASNLTAHLFEAVRTAIELGFQFMAIIALRKLLVEGAAGLATPSILTLGGGLRTILGMGASALAGLGMPLLVGGAAVAAIAGGYALYKHFQREPEVHHTAAEYRYKGEALEAAQSPAPGSSGPAMPMASSASASPTIRIRNDVRSDIDGTSFLRWQQEKVTRQRANDLLRRNQ